MSDTQGRHPAVLEAKTRKPTATHQIEVPCTGYCDWYKGQQMPAGYFYLGHCLPLGITFPR